MKKNLYLAFLSFVFACSYYNSYGDWSLQLPTSSFISKPANNAVGVEAPYLKITANVVEGATRYTIQLSLQADFSSDVITMAGEFDHQRTLNFTGLRYNTTYYARAMTDVSEYGRVSKFTTKAEVFPIVVSPVKGTNDANPVVLKIELSTVPNARHYTVELNPKSDFTGTSRFISSSLPNQSAFLFKDLKHGAAYFIRAKTDISTSFGPVTKVITRKRILQRRLWGLTTSAGAYDGGTIFSFSIDSLKFTKHHDYIESSDYPNSYADGSLVHAADNGFYGNSECTRNGTCGNGEIFHVSSQGEYKVLSQPGLHEGAIMLASNDHLYVVDDWINYFQGGILRIPTIESVFELDQVMFRIKSKSQGQNPRTALVEIDGYLYGVSPYGGSGNYGVVYKIKLDGSGFQVIHNFDYANGAYPQGHLLAASDGYLYGTTYSGGSGKQGTVFRIGTTGSSFKTLVNFSGMNGSQPHGSLVEKNGKLFGMTPAGGDNNRGTIFSVRRDGTAFSKMFSFNGVNGDAPLTTLTIVDNFLYGMTTWGGVNLNGVIFRIMIDGSSFQKLHDFTFEHGANPNGGLLLSEDFFQQNAMDTGIAMASSDKVTEEKGIDVFPNPFFNNFSTTIEDKEELPVKVIITTLQGEIVTEALGKTNSSLTLGDDLEKGIYILKTSTGDKTSIQRIVKK